MDLSELLTWKNFSVLLFSPTMLMVNVLIPIILIYGVKRMEVVFTCRSIFLKQSSSIRSSGSIWWNQKANWPPIQKQAVGRCNLNTWQVINWNASEHPLADVILFYWWIQHGNLWCCTTITSDAIISTPSELNTCYVCHHVDSRRNVETRDMSWYSIQQIKTYYTQPYKLKNIPAQLSLGILTCIQYILHY